jgi:hypothetical protein
MRQIMRRWIEMSDEDKPEETMERESYGAYEVMKLLIINKLSTLTKTVESVSLEIAQGLCKPTESSRAWRPHDFKELVEGVSGLYFLVKDKVDYLGEGKREKYKKLKALDDYLSGQRLWKDLTTAQFLEYAILLRSFCEESGLTRYEYEKKDDLSRIKEEMFSE